VLNTTNKQEKRTKIKFQAIRVSDKPCSTVFQCRATLRRSFFLFCALLFLLLTIVVLPIKQIELNFLTTKIIFTNIFIILWGIVDLSKLPDETLL